MKKIWGLLLVLCLCILPTMEGRAAKISSTSVVLQNGKYKTLSLKKAKGKITWSSSNKEIAVVSSKGKVLAKKQGTCYIIAVNGGKTYKCKVKVVQNKRTAKFLSIIKRYANTMNKDIANKKYWTYGPPKASGFNASRNKYRRTTCVYPVIWALREMKIFGVHDGFWAGVTNIKYFGKGKSISSKTFHYIKVNKPVSQLLEENQLQVGDILFLEEHTNVYAGNGKFYDTGRVGTNGNFIKNTYYFSTAGPVEEDIDFMANYILRFK